MPTNKVLAGAAAGALAAIITWASKAFGHVDVPSDIAIALSTLITFGVQYMTPDSTTPPTT